MLSWEKLSAGNNNKPVLYMVGFMHEGHHDQLLGEGESRWSILCCGCWYKVGENTSGQSSAASNNVTSNLHGYWTAGLGDVKFQLRGEESRCVGGWCRGPLHPRYGSPCLPHRCECYFHTNQLTIIVTFECLMERVQRELHWKTVSVLT